jgi:glycosyltransferase involved in cell wall biosynthesis
MKAEPDYGQPRFGGEEDPPDPRGLVSQRQHSMASSSPLVAIVTPVYNGEAYLAATMRCVQLQSYANIVHVVLDNCSTDGTAAIIEQFRDAGVKVISARNDKLLPMSENWNQALRMVPAEARYAKILCADDLIHRDCISRFVAIAESDQEIEVVLSDDVFEGKVRYANLSAGSTVFDGIATGRAVLNGSINWLPYHHLFLRLHDDDRNRPLFKPLLLFDCVAVFTKLSKGKLGYIHEPLVYTRWHAGSETSRYLGTKEVIPLLTRFDILIANGRVCWDEASFRKEVARARGRLARFALRWRLTGQRVAAEAIEKGLEDRGFPLSQFDYVRFALGWPAYLRWKRSWQRSHGPKIDETDFLSN